MAKDMDKFFKLATEATIRGIDNKAGGPFGATVVRKGEVVVSVSNTMLKDQDPTAHAELVAVQKACEILGTMDLSDCEIYATCQPCPMCVGAMMLAKVNKVYYSSTKEDAANHGFSDMDLRTYLDGSTPDKFDLVHVGKRDDCDELWDYYHDKTN